MVYLANQLIKNYNLHERTGFSDYLQVPNKDAAYQIVYDMKENDLFFQFVTLLIEVHECGLRGRNYKISYLYDILNEIHNAGFVYIKDKRIFVEDSRRRKTKNWGFLRKDEEYIFSFLYLDIVGNSMLVRNYPNQIIKNTYNDLYNIVKRTIETRNGRVWNWEGDGCLAAFYFSNKNLIATISAMEIIHELFIYNHTTCMLNEHLNLRLTVHSGQCEYTINPEDLKKSEPIKEIIKINSKYTKPNSISISETVYVMLDQIIAKEFHLIDNNEKIKIYNYELRWEH